MKIILWLIIPFFLLAAYFAVPQEKSQPENKSSAPQWEEPESVSTLEAVSLSLFPSSVLQGEPVLVTIDGQIDSSALSGLTIGGEALTVFPAGNHLAALVGIDLHRTPGIYPITLYLADGRTIEKTLEVKERVLAITDFDIPERMGGNTPQGEQELTQNLTTDTVTLNAITSAVSPEKLWEGTFRYPRDEPIVITDTYGYSRQTGSVNLSHNGTDFRAPVGTPVYAMNAGIVVFNGSFQNYGKTVIIDHGLGLMTMYMHLSEINVELDQKVEKGELIAKSGNTGYSLAPHLHLSVRIGGFSIDPQKFLELLGPK